MTASMNAAAILTATRRAGVTTAASAARQAGFGRSSGLPTQWTSQNGGPADLTATTVLLADPGRDSRMALASGLLAAGVGRLTQAESVSEVDDVIERQPAGQLALVSLAFDQECFRLIPALRKAGWQRVLALAPRADAEPIHHAMLVGASGVLRGHPAWPVDEVPERIHDLSPREIEVLSLVADGRSNKWIAEELSLSALTVKSHLARISRKLGTGDRSHLVAIAMRAGLLR